MNSPAFRYAPKLDIILKFYCNAFNEAVIESYFQKCPFNAIKIPNTLTVLIFQAKSDKLAVIRCFPLQVLKFSDPSDPRFSATRWPSG